MGFRDLDLKLSYESKNSNSHLLENFYIPVLQQSTKYFRVAGFFSSSALAVAGEGIEGLIHNKGKMYLLISPNLSVEDYEILRKKATLEEDSPIFKDFDLSHNVDDRIRAMAWMLDKDYLRIKIVVSKKSQNSLFHEKFGIFFDDKGDKLSFSGSINESAQGWIENIEEFKVFRSWIVEQNKYLRPDQKRFVDYWNNNREDIATVYDIPEAIKKKIIDVKPNNVEDLTIMRRYVYQGSHKEISLFPHQKKAVQKWLANGKRLMMEMATGTGKTRTALACILALQKELAHQKRPNPLLTIVATPQNTLSRQWKAECDELGIQFDKELIIDGSNHNWKTDLSSVFLLLGQGIARTAIIFSTHATASSNAFLKIVTERKKSTDILFICDEVHAIGSAKQRQALRPDYKFRVGLSATPQRMFDEEGTSLIREYFGNNSFEFTIHDALTTINTITGRPFLNNYNYNPEFVELTKVEQKKYDKLTVRTYTLKQKKDKTPEKWTEDDEKRLQRLYEQRANICKNAEGKEDVVRQLIQILGFDLEDTIIFVSDKQIDSCMEFLGKMGIKRAKITENISATKKVNEKGETERQSFISQFAKHEIQVLLGIKCLDEGIDIQTARIAILMSNSTNPREYIQRVGRVIRPHPGKKKSIIYDLIVLSNHDKDVVEDSILYKEAKRAQIIAENALNYDEVKLKFEEKGVILDDI